jgi:16S rRNA (adenine1518-N6/adenine1519-N6)-dimethyltransferase
MNLPPLKAVIAKHSLSAMKSLGQHFLLDPNVTDKIVRLAGGLQHVHVIEIGPGPGGLTRSLLASKAEDVLVVEYDDRAITIMQELQETVGERLQVMHADALKVNLIEHVQAPRAIVANLPYNVGTVLFRWLDDVYAHGADAYQHMTLMFQKEVVERIVACEGNKIYGKLSVMCQWLCEVESVMTLPAHAFTPPPKVDSQIVRLVPRKAPLFEADIADVKHVLQAAFGQRRKMLRSALKSLEINYEAAGIDPTLRAEQLSVQQFGQLVLATTFCR